MKAYLLVLMLCLAPLDILGVIDEQGVLDRMNGINKRKVAQEVVSIFANVDVNVAKKVCYNLLFQKEYLFLKDSDEACIKGSFVAVKKLRSKLLIYLKQHAFSLEQRFLEIYKERYITPVFVPEHYLSLYANQSTSHLLITDSTTYKLDPFYISFKEFENREDAARFMNYLVKMEIDFSKRNYATRRSFDSDDQFMNSGFPKNILDIIKEHNAISEDDMERFREMEIS